MKQIYCSLFFIVFLASCQNNQQVTSFVQAQATSEIESGVEAFIEMKVDKLLINTDSFDEYMKYPRITSKEYDQLQLFRMKEISDYDIGYITKANVILSNEKGKIVSIFIVTEGEISEYLLSYNKKGDLIDYVLVAYEDLVEYYSQISSSINPSELRVQTVNFNYEGDEETSDTIITKYNLTPDLKFEQD